MRLVLVLPLVIGCKFEPSRAPETDPGSDGSVTIDAPPIPDDWMLPWTHRKSITIHGSKVSAPPGGLIDFPVAIVLDDPEIGAIAQPGWTDVVFTGGDALTPLASDPESLDVNKLVTWVKLPILDATADTRIFVYYGHPQPPAANREAWTGNFKSVWHLSQAPIAGTTDEMLDATASHHGQASATMSSTDSIEGKLGRGLDFDGNTDFINVSSTVQLGNQFTLSAWIHPTASTGIKTIFSNSLSGLDKDGIRLFINSDQQSDRRVVLETSNGTTDRSASTDINRITFGVWNHLVAVVDRTAGTAQIFVNGVDQTISGMIRTDFLTSSDIELGRMEDDYEWLGRLDEVQLATEKRTSQWILTSFTNQDDPASFYLVGMQELAP